MAHPLYAPKARESMLFPACPLQRGVTDSRGCKETPTQLLRVPTCLLGGAFCSPRGRSLCPFTAPVDLHGPPHGARDAAERDLLRPRPRRLGHAAVRLAPDQRAAPRDQ